MPATNASDAHQDETLAALRADLIRNRPRPLRPDEGDEAFLHHTLLAAAVHRAAKLDLRGKESETSAWVRYVSEHYPEGRNDAADAKLLWVDWRTSLLKEGTPGPGVSLTHGQPMIHWRLDDDGCLCINLESGWDDFTASVDSFVHGLRTSPRRDVVLRRWREQRWIVKPFASNIAALAGGTVMDLPLSTSYAQTKTKTTLGSPPTYSVTANPPKVNPPKAPPK